MISKSLLFGLVFGLLSVTRINAQKDPKIKEQEIIKEIFQFYDKGIRPNGVNGTGPVEVLINLYVRSMILDDNKMEYIVQLTFRQQWLDERLSYERFISMSNFRFLTLTNSALIWKPDLFFSNEKTSHVHTLMAPNEYVRIFPNGEVLYSSRISMTLSCPMILTRFPFDAQTCSLRMASWFGKNTYTCLHKTTSVNAWICSQFLVFELADETASRFRKNDCVWWLMHLHAVTNLYYLPIYCGDNFTGEEYDGYTTEDIIFKWKRADPVQVTSDLHLPLFELVQFTTDYCDSQTNTGVYSCIRTDFLFKRYCRSYMLQIFIPCIMLVIIAWLSFWMDRYNIIARTIVVITAQFVMVAQVSAFNQRIPTVSYTKAIDIWTGVCLTFGFASLLELVVVSYFCRNETDAAQETPKNVESNDTQENVQTEEARVTVETKLAVRKKFASYWWSRFRENSISQKLDIIFRIFYPIVFVLFVIIYFSEYGGRKECIGWMCEGDN